MKTPSGESIGSGGSSSTTEVVEFAEIAEAYPKLRLAVVLEVCGSFV
jgi:hypothetical protein